jgi:peptidoglycan-N-acetylglucosamine deacetylase
LTAITEELIDVPEAAPAWGLRQVMRRVMAGAMPRRLFLVRGRARCRAVYLTFDDGPHPQFTPKVLDALRDAKVSATFFVVGARARENADLLRRIAREGHTVAHHSYSHSLPGDVSPEQLMEEVRETQKVFQETLGRGSSLIRPPHGKVTGRKLWALWRAGFTVVLWNRDPKDFTLTSAQQFSLWVRLTPPVAGDIVLLHDTNALTAAALPELIESVRGRGLGFVTVDQLLGRAGQDAGRRPS